MVAASVKGRILPRISWRDRRTLELRRLLPLPQGAEPKTYVLDTYLYFPRAFGVDKRSWGSSGFYRDAKVYLRISAQGLTLETLAQLDHPSNPGAILCRQIDDLLAERAPSGQVLASLARVYGAEVADAIEHEGWRLRDLLKTTAKKRRKKKKNPRKKGKKRLRRLEQAIDTYLHDAQHALGALRRLRCTAEAYRGVVYPELFSSLAFAEEYATSVLDEELAALARRIEAAPELRDGEGLATRLRLRIAATAHACNLRRVDEGFAIPWGTSGEFFTYRIGLLKKELQRSLYVDTRRLSRDPLYANTAAMVAAGLAATWATLAQLPLWTGSFTTSEGLFFLGAAVGAYMVKDRIKEWTRGMLAKRLLAWDHDRKIRPDALEEAGLASFSGRSRERMSFVKESSVPPEVTRARQAVRTVEGTSYSLEEIVHYQRSITLEPPQVGEEAPAAGLAVQEILRLSLTDVLRRLDEPLSRTEFYDPLTGRFLEQDLPRIYHLNVVVVAREEGADEARIARHRVIVDRDGVRRVENVLKERLPQADASS